jgi:hypothetical protein
MMGFDFENAMQSAVFIVNLIKSRKSVMVSERKLS